MNRRRFGAGQTRPRGCSCCACEQAADLQSRQSKVVFVDIEAAGLETVKEEQVSCCHAVQDKTYVADPDGELEVGGRRCRWATWDEAEDLALAATRSQVAAWLDDPSAGQLKRLAELQASAGAPRCSR